MSAISRTVLREQVKDILLHRIVSGDLKPGERLVETRIANELGTSQAPVREALRDLELLRLVESEPFRGARVRGFGEAELIEVYPVRAVLEEFAAKEATKQLDGDVTVLERELEAMRAAARRGDMNGLVEHDIAFHRRDRRVGRERRARAVLEVPRRRGPDHDLAVRHVRRARRGGRAARADPRGDPLRPAGRRGSRGAEARRGVRPDRAQPRAASAPALSARGTGHRARRAVPGGARAAPADRRRRPADRADPGRPRRLPRARRAARDDPRALHGHLRAGRGVPRRAARHAAGDDDRARADRRSSASSARSCRASGSSSCSPCPSGSGWGSGTPSLRSSSVRPCPTARRRAPACTRRGSRSARLSPRRSPCRSPPCSAAGAVR